MVGREVTGTRTGRRTPRRQVRNPEVAKPTGSGSKRRPHPHASNASGRKNVNCISSNRGVPYLMQLDSTSGVFDIIAMSGGANYKDQKASRGGTGFY